MIQSFNEFTKLPTIHESQTIDYNHKYGVFRFGGTIGDNNNAIIIAGGAGTCVITGDDKEELKVKASRYNKMLTPGEKKFYRMSYKVIELTSKIKNELQNK